MIHVLDVPLFDQDISAAVKTCISQINSGNAKENKCISATGAHGLVLAKKNQDLYSILSGFYLNLPDGMPSVWIGKLKGAKRMKRCYGPDFFKEFVLRSASYNIKHYFCGGKEGVAELLKISVKKKFNNTNVIGCFSPPFREMTEDEYAELGQEITELKSDIVWVGLSTPKQERFAHKLSNFTKTHFIITVGAAFDFHTGNVRQAPKFIQNLGLEWFFRLVTEPKRLWRRYLEVVPLFIYYNLIEFIKYLINKKEKDEK